jgi:hypothetical protein
MAVPKRASVPEGKALFFPRREADESESSADSTKTRQSAVFLEERHIDWLEDKCREARKNSGKAIRKAAIIRALIDVAMDAPIDLTGLANAKHLTDRIKHGVRQV